MPPTVVPGTLRQELSLGQQACRFCLSEFQTKKNQTKQNGLALITFTSIQKCNQEARLNTFGTNLSLVCLSRYVVTSPPKEDGYHPSLDFRCKASDSYDFSTRYESLLSLNTKNVPVSLHLTSSQWRFIDDRFTKHWILRLLNLNRLNFKFSQKNPRSKQFW